MDTQHPMLFVYSVSVTRSVVHTGALELPETHPVLADLPRKGQGPFSARRR